ncbi:MAG: 50S ribosomal protein L6 [FCB group bacterium]|nr:50S ribosomal protein L6 [FCB group bacterium]
MSRIGRAPVPIPSGVKLEIKGTHVKVTGPKGTLQREFDPQIEIATEEGNIVVRRPNDKPTVRALHGLTRALVSNMVTGVTTGFEKTLSIQGVGYRASMQGKSLNLQLGYSHPVTVDPPDGITFAVEGTQTIKVAGIDRELVGQTAANVRAWRKPEPYKGKGIRYENENVRRKVGKAGSK